MIVQPKTIYTLDKIYDAAIKNCVNVAKKGEKFSSKSYISDYTSESAILSIEAGSRNWPHPHRIREFAFLDKLYTTLKNTDKNLISEIHARVRDPLLDEAVAYLKENKGLDSVNREKFIEELSARTKGDFKRVQYFMNPLVLIEFVKQSPSSIDKLCEDSSFAMHKLNAPLPEKTKQDCEYEIAERIHELYSDELIKLISRIDEFCKRNEPGAPYGYSKLGKYLIPDQAVSGPSFRDNNSDLESKLDELYGYNEMKREIYETLWQSLWTVEQVMYSNKRDPKTNHKFRVRPKYYMTSKSMISNYSFNQLLYAWIENKAITETSLTQLTKYYSFKKGNSLIIIDHEKNENVCTDSTKYRNTTVFLPICVWLLKEFYKIANDVLNSKINNKEVIEKPL